MASRRAALASRSVCPVDCSTSASGSLQVGQRLAKPGLPGFSSNSSWQTTQILIGKAIAISILLGVSPSPYLKSESPENKEDKYRSITLCFCGVVHPGVMFCQVPRFCPWGCSSIQAMMKTGSPPVTPDGRYFVVRGRLWRCANPSLSSEEREGLVRELMKARREKGVAMRAGDADAKETARAAIDEAKRRLGERGEVWWTDGAKDWNRHMVRNTPYADWFEGLKQAQIR
jgi:hypothetical protein